MSSLPDVRTLTARVMAARSAAPASVLDRLTVGDTDGPFMLPTGDSIASFVDGVAARLAASCEHIGQRLSESIFNEPTERHRIVRLGGLGGTRIARRTMKELLS